jgi:hypothetical protein
VVEIWAKTTGKEESSKKDTKAKGLAKDIDNRNQQKKEISIKKAVIFG